MKNLIKTSTIAVVILSLFAVSCEKPKSDELPAPKPDIEAPVTWDPKGSAKSGETVYGPVGIAYRIIPKINITVCESGKWSVTVVGPAGSAPGYSIDEGTGAVGVTPFTKGTYTVKITYKCPGCTEISITVIIKVE